MYTKLDLVNACLRAIGNDRVSALDYPDVDTDAAITVVEETTVDVLSQGWWFNQECWSNLVPNNEGRVAVPKTVISIRPEGVPLGAELVVRSGYLFDKTNQTWDIRPLLPPSGLKMHVILLLELEDIPAACQQYIRTRSRAKMMQDMDSDLNKIELEQREELRYLAILERNHRNYMKTNNYNTPKVRAVMGSLASQSNYMGGPNPLGKDEC